MPRATRKRKSVQQTSESEDTIDTTPPKQPRVAGADEDDELVTHPEVSCDVSDMYPLRGTRWHKIDEDFDLCQAEFDKLADSEKRKYERIDIPGATPIPYSSQQNDRATSVASVAKRIQQLEKNARLGPKHANDIIELLELCEVYRSDGDKSETDIAEDVTTSYKAIHALHRVFKSYNAYVKPRAVKKRSTDVEEPETPMATFEKWVHEQYLDYLSTILRIIQAADPALLAIPCMNIFMDFVTKYATSQNKARRTDYKVPNPMIHRLMGVLTHGCCDKAEIIESYVEKYLLPYDDIWRASLKALTSVCSQILETSRASKAASLEAPPPLSKELRTFMGNVYCILDKIDGSRGTRANPEEPNPVALIVKSADVVLDEKHPLHKRNTYQRAFTDVWLAYLKLRLPVDIFKNVLLRICDETMPHLTEPKLLIDFLRDSYELGGVTSILALQGVFTLMHQYNLDYPDFYSKLYKLFDGDIFHIKYRSRFFRLADLFLKSTHLPSYIVGAFIKRTSRLCLRAPPAGSMVGLRFIYNLLKRHPSCKVLIHREGDAVTSYTDDPFVETEENPAKCRALDSSLWETQALLQHYHADVARLPQVLSAPALRLGEMDMRRAAQGSYATMYHAERQRTPQAEVADCASDDEESADRNGVDNFGNRTSKGATMRTSRKGSAVPLAFVAPTALFSECQAFQQWAVHPPVVE
eukprot:m.289644 g.289644  ORF g.289644 m.289644 type:complete len:698 (+) comp19970_c0_seq1:186-2279(+)